MEEQDKLVPDELPSGFSAANLGYGVIPVPVFFEEPPIQVTCWVCISGITAADVGYASLSIPVFYSEEDYPGPNVIEVAWSFVCWALGLLVL